MKLADVSERDLGVWVRADVPFNMTEHNLEIIKMAINTYGWEQYSMTTWKGWHDLHEAETPEIVDDTLRDELAWVLDEAVEWLTSQLPAGYYFTFENTDFILTHEDYEVIK
jgi:hypothetical protein